MITTHIVVSIVIGIIIGTFIGFWTRKRIVENQFDSIKNYSKKIINEAHRKAKTLKKEALLQAKDTFYQMKLDFEKETKEKRGQLQSQERRLFNKEENLDKKIERLEQKEKYITKKEKSVEQIENDIRRKQSQYEEVLADERVQLERLSGISSKEAKKLLIKSMESEARHDAAKLIRGIENDTKETARREANNILALAVKRYAGD